MRCIIRKALVEKGLKDLEEELENTLVAGFIKLLLHLHSDRQLVRYLPNHPNAITSTTSRKAFASHPFNHLKRGQVNVDDPILNRLSLALNEL